MYKALGRGPSKILKACVSSLQTFANPQVQSCRSLPSSLCAYRYATQMTHVDGSGGTIRDTPVAQKMKSYSMVNCMNKNFAASLNVLPFSTSILSPALTNSIFGQSIFQPLKEPSRTITKFSLLKGRRKSCGAVKRRFFRLDWGGWISAQPGRARHLWRKPEDQKAFLRNHVFRSATEVKLLDKLVTRYWIKKKYFVDDPYESYHTRDNFRITRGVQGIASTNLYKVKPYHKGYQKGNFNKW